MTTPTGSLVPDTLVHGRYKVVSQIGRGGMGAVYEAIDTRLGNTVALKQTLVRGAQLDDAFAREARLLSSLRHAALPVVSDYFAEGDSHFLVMQFIPGTDFGALMAQRSAPFDFGEVLPWAYQLLDALDYLHTQSPPIIHRDIKPQNLKLTPRGEIVLLDFGLAKGGSAGAEAGAPAGASLYGYTPQYAPLEQIQATGTDPRSDLYSLAATLYALLANQPPANALDRASALLQGQPDLLRPLDELSPQVPAAVSRLFARCMALNLADRPASAAVVRAELAAALRTGSAGASTAGMVTIAQPTRPVGSNQVRPAPPPPPPPTPTVSSSTGNRTCLVLGIIGVLALLMIGAVGAALISLTNSFVADLNPDGTAPPVATIGVVIEEDPSPTAAGIPNVVIPTVGIPGIDATIAAVQTTAQAMMTVAAGGIPGLPSNQDSQAQPDLSFGAEGTGNGFLNDPRGVAVGPDGAIYVADFTGRVQRFSADGTFERSFLIEDDRPILAIATDRQGRLYVSQNFAVSVFDGASGELVGTITDAEGSGFEDLVITGDGGMLGIPWAGDDIVRLDAEGHEVGRLKAILEKADADGQPAAVASDGLGTIYVLDNSGENVFVFGPDGQFRDRFSVPNPWAFSDMAIDGQGRIYVTNFFGGGIAIFSAEGTSLGSLPSEGIAFDLVFDDKNTLYAVTNAPRVLRFNLGS